MEDTTGLPKNLIRCALAEVAIRDIKRRIIGAEKMEDETEMVIKNVEDALKVVMAYRRKMVKRNIRNALVVAFASIAITVSVVAVVNHLENS